MIGVRGVQLLDGRVTARSAAELNAFLVGAAAMEEAMATCAPEADATDIGRAAMSAALRLDYLRRLGVSVCD